MFAPLRLASLAALLVLPTALRAQDRFDDDPFGGRDSDGGQFGDLFGSDARAGQPARPRRSPPGGELAAPARSPFRQPVYWSGPWSAAQAKIEAALDAPLTQVGLDFTATPLEDVVAFLRKEYGIPIHLDLASLDELAIGADEPINTGVWNVSLRTALRVMLDPIECDFYINREVLMIATEEEAEVRLQVGIYPVNDLQQDADTLIDALVTTVVPETWAVNGGGEAEMRMLRSGMLMVSQTQRGHEAIIDALTALRVARGLPAPINPTATLDRPPRR